MADDVSYILTDDGLGFGAHVDGHRVGQITFVRVGIDKMIIDHTDIDDEFRARDVASGLVGCVVDLARRQGRRILCMCPVARAIFNRTPEYDDVRLINMH